MFVLTHPHAVTRRAGFHPAWSRAVERLLDERTEARSDAAQVPAMDVSESEAGYSLSFDLPGIVKEQVKVSIDGRKLSVEAAPAEAAAETEGARVHYPELALCTDNGAMIALAAAMRLQRGRAQPQTDFSFSVAPRWDLAAA